MTELSAARAPERSRSVLRWGGLVALLVAEVAWLSMRVDTGALLGSQAWWAGLLSYSPDFFAALAAVAGAVGLAFWSRERSSQRPVAGLFEPASLNWLFLILHLATFAGLSILTIGLVEGSLGEPGVAGGLWFFAWGTVGAASVVFWAGTGAPLRRWLGIVGRRPGWLVAGVAVGAVAWVAGLLTETAWVSLSRPTLEFVEGLLELLDQQVVSQPEKLILGIETPSGPFTVEIVAECSGYQGVGLVWVFLGCYLWLERSRLRFPHALLLIPLGTLMIWLTNVVRIASLVLIGAWVSPDLALGGFHSQTGWLSFIAVALGLIALAQASHLFSIERTDADSWRDNPTLAYLAPFLVVVAASMLSAAVSTGFDWLYPARVILTLAVIWIFWSRSAALAALRTGCSEYSFGLGVLVFGAWILFEKLAAPGPPSTTIPDALGAVASGWAALWVAFRVVGAVVMAPIAEELAFRGYLTRRIISEAFEKVPPGSFTWVSFLLSSVLFGALHGRWLAGTLAGMAYALAYYRRGRLAEAIVAHATTNALIAVYVLLSGSWSLWERM